MYEAAKKSQNITNISHVQHNHDNFFKLLMSTRQGATEQTKASSLMCDQNDSKICEEKNDSTDSVTFTQNKPVDKNKIYNHLQQSSVGRPHHVRDHDDSKICEKKNDSPDSVGRIH